MKLSSYSAIVLSPQRPTVAMLGLWTRSGVNRALASCALLLAAIPATLGGQPAPPPPAVTVAPIVLSDVAPVYSFIGRVIAIQSVDVVPRVTASSTTCR